MDAYLVRHIVQAIARRAEPDSTIDVDADELKPIFQSNVGLSAWGLAVHSQARIIAVSANTHNITIFRFALIEEDKVDMDDQHDESTDAGPDRTMDYFPSVINGSSNIPYIAFCNTGDDPDGRWLLTTDISGFCRSVDLHAEGAQISQTFRFGRHSSYASDSHDRFNSGWAIMFLDRESFLPEEDAYAALGLGEGEPLLGIKDSKQLWDIGATVTHIPDVSSKFSVIKTPRRRSSGVRSDSAANPSSAVQSSRSEIEPSTTSGEAPPIMNEGTGHAHDPPEEDPPTSGMVVDTDMESEGEAESSDAESFYHAEIDLDDEGTEDTVSFSAVYGGRRICGNEPQADLRNPNNICGDLPCPVLHASVRNCYLLQPSSHRQGSSPFTPPTVGFTNALHQLVQGEFSYLNVFERLNMNTYIPQIGIVVLASQKGRALVLSLTKLSKKTKYPPEMQESVPSKKTIYAMRMERILPFAQQEENMERPFAPLVGLSSGPVQGTEHLPNDQKRWRLLMMFADHTVLSYEIRRRRLRDSAVDIEGLVV